MFLELWSRRRRMKLIGTVQNYHWGKKGCESEVARLAANNVEDYNVEESKFYAELWMGTHASGPSVLEESGELLSEWLEKNPACLGEGVSSKFKSTNSLPFLFKVLSIKQPLSIQAHPSKELAEKLHKEKPHIYKDPNHKPEMALALSPFEALCGFRPIKEIKKFMKDVPELRCVIGESLVAEFLSADEPNLQTVLRKCFQAMLSASDEIMKNALQQLIASLSSLDESTRVSLQAELIERLHSLYPGDVGCFGPYLFNYLCLKPGDAIFLAANEPHAYISGDCIECMACSDNVVRAGLTPKMKDVQTLCDMLTYICEPAEQKFFQGHKEDEFSTLFKPPIPDFAVAKITIPRKTNYETFPRNSASISIVICGKGCLDGMNIKRGNILFVGACQTMSLSTTEEDLLLFQAMANV